MPLSFFPLYLVLKNLIYFCHAFLVIVLVLIIFKIPFSTNQLLFFPNLFLLIGNLFWITLLFGIIGAKFRDFEQIVSSLMPMFFFLSPIIYKPDQLHFASLLVWLNPFTYMISLIRDPLLNIQPELIVYKVSIISLFTGLFLCSVILGKAKLKIPFWV
jgi:ABC-type polysaccharide/polyol phosphate export permease